MIHGGDMNELIKELAEQATLAVTKPDGHYIVQAWQAKFAELIISECKNAFWKDECNTSDLAMAFFRRNVKKIEQHFGIVL